MSCFRLGAFVIGLVGWLSAGMASGGLPRGVVFVVVSGQAVVVHLESGRVLRRLDFTELLQPGYHAKLEGDQLLVIGDRRGASKSGCVRIDPRLMRIRAFTHFPGEVVPWKCFEECTFPAKPNNVNVKHHQKTDGSPPGLQLVVESPRGKDIELSVDQHPQASPYEHLDRWTMTPDRKRLVILSTGGFKYQCYLRIYDYPSLRRRATVPILKIRDHVPIGLFVFQGAAARSRGSAKRGS